MLSVVLAGAIAVGMIGIQGLHAGEEYQPEQYRLKMTGLMKSALAGMPGTEAHVFRAEAPPGWMGGKHYHQGHVLVYILEGTMTFELDGKAPITVGEVKGLGAMDSTGAWPPGGPRNARSWPWAPYPPPGGGQARSSWRR